MFVIEQRPNVNAEGMTPASTAECDNPQMPPFIRRERPTHAILGMLLMSVGFAVCYTGFFGFVLAAPFWVAGFVFCVMTALALVNREWPTRRRIAGAVVVVLGIVCLVNGGWGNYAGSSRERAFRDLLPVVDGPYSPGHPG